MGIAHLRQQLEIAEQQAKRSDGTLQELLARHEAVSNAQRVLADAQGLDYAVPLDIGCWPEAGVSGAVLLGTEYCTFLTFNAVQADEGGERRAAGTAVVEFRRCIITQFGHPNDEALAGHPLHQRGLTAYGVFEVRNSGWIRQLTERNRVAFPKTPDSKQTHFVFCFHDSTFECVSDSLEVTLTAQPYAEVLTSIAQRATSLDG